MIGKELLEKANHDLQVSVVIFDSPLRLGSFEQRYSCVPAPSASILPAVSTTGRSGVPSLAKIVTL